MSLQSGSRLGPYEILTPIGAGGMGEVYKAKDTRLERTVAIKVLPDTLSGSPERKARFEREAKAISALNHPHICTLYDVGEQDGIDYLVMEHLEGETLADRLERGALPLEQVLRYGAETAEALDKAHRNGVVHRDLKPGNMMLTKSGVKLLDFGLARLRDEETVVDGLSGLKTQAKPLTREGALLGTLQYMAPEQLEGTEADSRADIWALGLVLYEMTTGKLPFTGQSPASLIASILGTEPRAMSELQPLTPPALEWVVQKCLAKDRGERWQSASDLASVLGRLAEIGSHAGDSERRNRRRPAVLLAWGLLGLSIVGGAWWTASRRESAPPVTRTLLTGPTNKGIALVGVDPALVITPDGSRVVYVGERQHELIVRRLDTLEPVTLTTALGLREPFVSPDGQWVGFFENTTTLKKVAITGGPAIVMSESTTGQGPRGASWAADNSIVLGDSNPANGLLRLPADGGQPVMLTRPDPALGEADHIWPELLPNGEAVLFTIAAMNGGLDAAQVAILDLRSGKQKILLHGASHAHYVSSGHLVFAASGALRAVAFDLDRLKVRGESVPVVPRLVVTEQGAAEFSVSRNGTLVYVDSNGAEASFSRSLVWVDREGKEEPVAAPPRFYLYPRISPDGTKVAVSILDQGTNVWTWDLTRSTLTRLTSDFSSSPVWSADGRRVLFGAQQADGSQLYWQNADGTGAAELLTRSDNPERPSWMSADAREVLFTQVSSDTGRDIQKVTLSTAERSATGASDRTRATPNATGDVEPLLATHFNEGNGVVSPDGRWLAYESDGSGRSEIYVRPYPNVNEGQWQVSTDGGQGPLWSPTGGEMFYAALDGAIYRVPVDGRTTWSAGAPTKLFDSDDFVTQGGLLSRMYDISPDGRRFLMIKQLGTDPKGVPPSIVVVTNWFEELKRLVPVK